MWFDKVRGVLQVSGSEACVAAAKNLIDGLGGPRMCVSTSVWAELLRTRKLRSGSDANVARIQLESGCRIHVERSCQEVHLFGNAESVAIAQKLLKEMDQNCVSEVMEVSAESVNTTTLQSIAHSCSVTFQHENGRVCMLGMRDAVKKAAATLSQCLTDPDFVMELAVPTPVVSDDAQEVSPKVAPAQSLANAPPNRAKKDIARGVCPTCKACPFCQRCGHPTTFVDNADASGFAANAAGNPRSYPNKVDNDQMPPYMWQQMPFVRYDGTPMSPVYGDQFNNMVPMVYTFPNSQNQQVRFVPAQMMAG
jgi:hypothetical protein